MLAILLTLLMLTSLSCAAHIKPAVQRVPVEVFAYGRLIVHEWVADDNDICFEQHAWQESIKPFPNDCISLGDLRAFARSRAARRAD